MLSAMPSVSPTRWWSREEWHEYTEDRNITIEDWFTARYDADDFDANGVHFSCIKPLYQLLQITSHKLYY